jgi:hypothetical protein
MRPLAVRRSEVLDEDQESIETGLVAKTLTGFRRKCHAPPKYREKRALRTGYFMFVQKWVDHLLIKGPSIICCVTLVHVGKADIDLVVHQTCERAANKNFTVGLRVRRDQALRRSGQIVRDIYRRSRGEIGFSFLEYLCQQRRRLGAIYRAGHSIRFNSSSTDIPVASS